ncbi:MAG: S49 family peptidase [Candidatus Nanopelagicales bacterium]|nr:S49 family peptidase [Candidatus Nanopelagicales bacterium]
MRELFDLDPVWCIRPEYVGEVCRDWLRMAGMEDTPTPEMQAQKRGGEQRIEGAVAVLPIHGPIFHRANLLTRWGYGCASEEWGRMFDSIAASDDIGAIVLDVDSPGGMHAGTEDMANRIYKARRAGRPIIAVSNDLMASAAYWAGSAADEVVVSPGSLTGSVGVILMHVEFSKALDAMGVKVNLIQAGEFKTEGNPYEPLTDEGRKHLQSLVDSAYADFRAGAARNRGVDADTVEMDFGQGRVYGERDAIRRGLADREATLDQVLLKLGVKNPGKQMPIGADRPAGIRNAMRRRRAEIGR